MDTSFLIYLGFFIIGGISLLTAIFLGLYSLVKSDKKYQSTSLYLLVAGVASTFIGWLIFINTFKVTF